MRLSQNSPGDAVVATAMGPGKWQRACLQSSA